MALTDPTDRERATVEKYLCESRLDQTYRFNTIESIKIVRNPHLEQRFR